MSPSPAQTRDMELVYESAPSPYFKKCSKSTECWLMTWATWRDTAPSETHHHVVATRRDSLPHFLSSLDLSKRFSFSTYVDNPKTSTISHRPNIQCKNQREYFRHRRSCKALKKRIEEAPLKRVEEETKIKAAKERIRRAEKTMAAAQEDIEAAENEIAAAREKIKSISYFVLLWSDLDESSADEWRFHRCTKRTTETILAICKCYPITSHGRSDTVSKRYYRAREGKTTHYHHRSR
ncbi:hypothetical protein EVJ58_g2855 [Rhodofomes roseus]|uniref:Uncharacterized protein n=1 Tax=Rhodofomes roseus TaxID=34475 RepID=A0A4Y9YNT1_9APHY|nr:hypothetical protein EVJ58_g2855 [Rhodofomes roseus]